MPDFNMTGPSKREQAKADAQAKADRARACEPMSDKQVIQRIAENQARDAKSRSGPQKTW